MTTKNTRINPFTGAVNWTAIIAESHTIALDTDKGLYGFSLTEQPQTGSITIADVSTGAATGATFTVGEASLTTPDAGTIIVDVTNGTGWCWCNQADDAASVEVSYNGGGFVANEDNLTNEFSGLNQAQVDARIVVDNLKVVYIKNIQSADTHGGTFTQDAWQTRPVNTLENPQSHTWVTLSSNQFTLDAGTYELYFVCPAYDVGLHKSKLRNITDASDDIIGDSMYAETSANVINHSAFRGVITIAAQKTFEAQHYCQATKTNTGFGQFAGFSVAEVYTQGMIRRLS